VISEREGIGYVGAGFAINATGKLLTLYQTQLYRRSISQKLPNSIQYFSLHSYNSKPIREW
jgi:hypothetical protein